jgi:hypothetical protein
MNYVPTDDLGTYLKSKTAIETLRATYVKVLKEAQLKLKGMQKSLYKKHMSDYEKVLFRVVETLKKIGVNVNTVNPQDKINAFNKVMSLASNYEIGYKNGITKFVCMGVNKMAESGQMEVIGQDDIETYRNANVLNALSKQNKHRSAWKKGENYQQYKSNKKAYKDVSQSSSTLTEILQEETQVQQVYQIHEERRKQQLNNQQKSPVTQEVAFEDLSTQESSGYYEAPINIHSRPDKLWANLKDHQDKMAKLKVGSLIEDVYTNYRISHKKVGWIRYGVKFQMERKAKAGRELDREVPQSVYQSDKMQKALDMTLRALIRENVVKPHKNPKAFGKLFIIEQSHNAKLRLIYDCRLLNQYFQNVPINLPSIFNALSSNRYYCKVDIENCYYNFKLENEFSKYFGFHYKGENYIWKRMPFGWSLAPYV